MNTKRRNRLLLIITMLLAVSVATALILYALRQNISLFYTPSQIVKGEAPIQQVFRVGGLVIPGSVAYSQDGSEVSFALGDQVQQVTVNYRGLLPDLFREGQGIVAQGRLENKTFIASQVYAKHDESYRPPEVEYALSQAKK